MIFELYSMFPLHSGAFIILQDESAAQIGKAEGQGNKLAREVSDNMEMMENVNKQLSDIMNSSLKVKIHQSINNK